MDDLTRVWVSFSSFLVCGTQLSLSAPVAELGSHYVGLSNGDASCCPLPSNTLRSSPSSSSFSSGQSAHEGHPSDLCHLSLELCFCVLLTALLGPLLHTAVLSQLSHQEATMNHYLKSQLQIWQAGCSSPHSIACALFQKSSFEN